MGICFVPEQRESWRYKTTTGGNGGVGWDRGQADTPSPQTRAGAERRRGPAGRSSRADVALDTSGSSAKRCRRTGRNEKPGTRCAPQRSNYGSDAWLSSSQGEMKCQMIG